MVAAELQTSACNQETFVNDVLMRANQQFIDKYYSKSKNMTNQSKANFLFNPGWIEIVCIHMNGTIII